MVKFYIALCRERLYNFDRGNINNARARMHITTRSINLFFPESMSLKFQDAQIAIFALDKYPVSILSSRHLNVLHLTNSIKKNTIYIPQ